MLQHLKIFKMLFALEPSAAFDAAVYFFLLETFFCWLLSLRRPALPHSGHFLQPLRSLCLCPCLTQLCCLPFQPFISSTSFHFPFLTLTRPHSHLTLLSSRGIICLLPSWDGLGLAGAGCCSVSFAVFLGGRAIPMKTEVDFLQIRPQGEAGLPLLVPTDTDIEDRVLCGVSVSILPWA